MLLYCKCNKITIKQNISKYKLKFTEHTHVLNILLITHLARSSYHLYQFYHKLVVYDKQACIIFVKEKEFFCCVWLLRCAIPCFLILPCKISNTTEAWTWINANEGCGLHRKRVINKFHYACHCKSTQVKIY